MAEWKSQTIPLIYPVEMEGSAPITSVTVREPDVEALEAIEDLGITEAGGLGIRQIRGMIVALSDLTDDQAKRLHRKDMEVLAEKIEPFISDETDPPAAT